MGNDDAAAKCLPAASTLAAALAVAVAPSALATRRCGIALALDADRSSAPMVHSVYLQGQARVHGGQFEPAPEAFNFRCASARLAWSAATASLLSEGAPSAEV